MTGFVQAVPGSIWDFPLFPEQASTMAPRVDAIFFALISFATFMTVLICFLVLFFVVKYRAGSSADRHNPITKTTRYEIVWLSVPAVIALTLAIWAAAGYVEYLRPPPEARTIYVVGKQWMWKIQHPEGPREINALHLPAGQPVRLVMTSQDVIHSFYIPAFRVKRDVLPGRYMEMWFTPTAPGVYPLFCTEYCGAEHSDMIGEVVVMRPAEFEQWLSAGAPPEEEPVPGMPGRTEAPLALPPAPRAIAPPPEPLPEPALAEAGARVFFGLGCNACHLPTSAQRAPRLDGIYGGESRLRNNQNVIVDAEYIRESILQPNAKIVAGYDAPSLMPTYRGQITEQQLNALVAFIASLREGWPEEWTQPPLDAAPALPRAAPPANAPGSAPTAAPTPTPAPTEGAASP